MAGQKQAISSWKLRHTELLNEAYSWAKCHAYITLATTREETGPEERVGHDKLEVTMKRKERQPAPVTQKTM